MTSAVRIGNCSGFYGDRLAAMREMLEGGELDYLTGDYLAELTMLILARDRTKSTRPRVRQDVPHPGRGVPRHRPRPGRANRRQRRRSQPGGPGRPRCDRWPRSSASRVRVAHVEGDDLVSRAAELGFGTPLTANAYLGAWGIVDCLDGRRRRRRHRPGHRRFGDRRPGGRPLRLGPRRLRPAGRRGGRGPRHRVRHPGHRRQLRVLHRDSRPDVRRASRSPRSTPTGRRSSPSTPAPAALVSVDTVTAQLLYEITGARYAKPGRDRADRHHRADRRRARSGADQRRHGRAAAAHRSRCRSTARRLPQRR